jgi:cell division septation protein DedD
MFYAKMNDDDDELPRYEEEDEGLEHPHDGDVIEEGEETIVEIGMGEEEPETPSQAPGRKQAPAARKKTKKAAPKKKAKAKAKAKPKKKARAKKPAKKSARRKKR